MHSLCAELPDRAQCPTVQQEMRQILRLPAVAQPAPRMTGIFCAMVAVVNMCGHFCQRVHVGTKLCHQLGGSDV